MRSETTLPPDTDEPVDGAPRVVRVLVSAADAGVRVDRVLAWRVPELSRAEIQRLIRAGLVSAAGRVVEKAKEAVRQGDEIEVRIPPPEPETVEGEAIPLDILYEDADIVVIDKPPGICSHPSPGHPGGTLVHALVHHFDTLSEVRGLDRAGIVHRLDKDTSGVIVCAKNDLAHRNLQDQFRLRRVRKAYRAIVWGRPVRDEGIIDAPIGRSRRDRLVMAIRPDIGRRAVTRYRVVETFGGRFSYLALYPRTGRTHQIRVHLRHLGFPIIGDEMYGRERRITVSQLLGPARKAVDSPAEPRALQGTPVGTRDPIVLARQALHARTIAFAHPTTGEWLKFRAPMPGDLRRVLKILKTGELPVDLRIAGGGGEA